MRIKSQKGGAKSTGSFPSNGENGFEEAIHTDSTVKISWQKNPNPRLKKGLVRHLKKKR
jgi:hypothetical protein